MNRPRTPVRRPPAKRTHWPEERGSDCYDWITPDEVVRMALGAFYQVSRHLDRLPADPAGTLRNFTNGRAEFAEDVAEIFALRLQELGFKAGAPGFDYDPLPIIRTRFSADLENPAPPASKIPEYSSGPDIHRAL